MKGETVIRIVTFGVSIAAVTTASVLAFFESTLDTIFFLGAIVVPLSMGLTFVLRDYMKAPRESPTFVTWGALVTILMGLYIPIVSAMLWIAFTLGELTGKIDAIAK